MLSARGGILEREHPFGVARQLLGSPRRGRRPAGAARSTAELLFEVLDEMYGQLARRAGDRPLLVCVDDAHWADTESLRLCAYLAARIESLPALLLLGADRSTAATPASCSPRSLPARASCVPSRSASTVSPAS